MKEGEKSVEEIWTQTWEPILMKNGEIDIEQLKKELADFSDLIDRHTSLVCEVTRHRLSYATYPVKTILSVMEECEQEEREWQRKEDKEDGVCSLCEQEINE